MMQITGVNLLALRLMAVVFSLVFLTGGFVVVLLSGPYHSQIMETHIEELFYLAEHNQENHSSEDHTRKAPEGLGLSIAREIVLNHGGDLRLNSTGHEGSVFRVLFPATVLEDQSS